MMNSRGRHGCRIKAHAAKRWEIYDSLPREVRDRLKIDKNNLCAGCIRVRIRREGLETVLEDLDTWRRLRRERQDGELCYVPDEELRP